MDLQVEPPVALNTGVQLKHTRRNSEPKTLRRLRKPTVSVQPWLNSSVWENAPTIPLKYHCRNPPQQKQKTARFKITHSSQGKNSGQHGPGKHTSSSLQTRSDSTAPSQVSHSPTHPILQPQNTPAEVVRSAWANRFELLNHDLN